MSFLSSQHRLRPTDYLTPRNISRKSLSDVLEEHYEHRKQQVVDLFDRMLEEFMKDQMNGFNLTPSEIKTVHFSY